MSDQLVILDQGFKINEATEKPAMIDSKMMPMPRGGKVTQVPTLESPSDCNAISWAACEEDTKLQTPKQHWDLPLLETS